MKTKNKIKLFFATVGVLALTSCKKEADNIFNMFEDVTVEFKNSDPRTVTDYKVINDKDEVWLDYTITSGKEDIYNVIIERTTATGWERTTVTPRPTDAQRRSYSGLAKYTLLRDGKTSFRVYAQNSKGIYIGDGYKKVEVEQVASYTHIANRDIYLPDTVAKVLPAYFSLRTGQSYSYTDGAANTGNIDFGIWRRSDNNASNPQWIYNLYSPSIATNPFPTYDVSSWTGRRTTKFSAPIAGQATVFATTIVSGSVIETEAKKRTINLDATVGNTATNGLVAGSVVYFLTPENKYGVMLVNAVTSDYNKRPYINVSVKIQN